MKEKNLFTIWLLTIVLFNNVVAICQNIDESYNLSSKYYKENDYEHTKSLLLRINYFDTLRTYTVPSNLILGQIAEIDQDYYLAINHYKQALRHNFDSLKRQVITYKIIACYASLGDYASTKEFLNFSCIDTNDTKYNIVNCLAGLLESNYSFSKYYYVQAFGKMPSEVANNYKKLDKIQFKNIKKAKILNAMLPGAGMLYLGSKKDALNAPLLLASLGSLSMYYGSIYGWLNSMVTFSPWISRYYFGGITRMDKLKSDLEITYKQKIISTIANKYNNTTLILKTNP